MQKQIENILHKALLLKGNMDYELYKFELEEHIDYWKKGLKKDEEDFVFVVTEREGYVAMLLITKDNDLFINEKAREQLKLFWKKNYKKNLGMLLPYMAKEISNEIISVTGVKFAKE
jgi:hypothetical protein